MSSDADILRSIPVSEFIEEHISAMPDRPDVLVVILNHDQQLDGVIIKGMAGFKEAYIGFTSLSVYGLPSFGICLMGFHSWTEVLAGSFLSQLASLPFDEAAVFVGSQHRMRLLPVEQPLSAGGQAK